MVTKFATGLSKGGAEAAKEAVSQAKEKLAGARVDLSIVFSSSEYDHRAVVDAVRDATNNAPLIGASTAGEFTEERVGKGSVAVGLLTSDDIKVFTALAEGVKEDPEAAIKEVAAMLPRDIEGYPYSMDILMIDGLAGVGEEVTLWASYLFGREQRIVGGMAGDDFKMEQTFVFSDDKVCTNALSVCHLTAKMPLFTSVKHGHRPLSRALAATKTKGNVLYEIDNSPAWEIWKEETAEVARKRGIEVEELETPAEIAQFFTIYSLGFATGKEGEYKIRWPSGINEDGSINFSCAIAEGAVFRIRDGTNLENQIKTVEEAAVIAKRNAVKAGYSDFAGVIAFDCAVRQLMLGDRFSEAVDYCKKVLPEVPLLGWETYGEIRLEPGQFSGFHNNTSVILLIPNGDKKKGRIK